MTLRRFDVYILDEGDCYRSIESEECDDGRWVEAEEALAEIDRLKKELEAAKIALGVALDQQPCEICGDTECPDANTDYYIRRWKETQELLKNLVDYVENTALLQCDCYLCALCEAKKNIN